MSRTCETGHPDQNPDIGHKNPDTGHRARVRTSGHVRCPAEPSPVSGCPVPSDRLSETAKYRIELEANRAAADFNSRRDACRWPYDSMEGQHWTACFLLAGGKI